ncbi:hypothetical protein HOP50_04g31290 [Chloropicon primus]|uniref:Uncharacterized protein n=1 Tax=Chloropicon primus TaxID=1764295 RepID=A0A5B8MJM7_9CHLO|nr:hypothetical protein A3770_04p31270 [Chloropicon primus]UPQ99820.1 hypothetical protein HOP50_04g31290 [Chloropicon primus]|eukprot:QDZ20609.1 hypothetical protein A3770_04p31270 [Chloropicon primus]
MTVDHGYDNVKGVMLCERPLDSVHAGAKYSSGSKGGVGSPSEPFKSAVAETNELGLPPTGESRSKISSLVARNRRIRRYTQNNALTKHRRWLSRLGVTAKVAKAADELNQIEAEERKRKFKNFTTALRKKILEGSPLDNVGWASLTRGQELAATRESTPKLGDGEGASEAPTEKEADHKKLTKTLKKKERDEVDLEMSMFLDEAVQDALEREKEYREQEAAEAAAEAEAEAAEKDEEKKASDALRRENSKAAESSKNRPAWALSKEQAQAREEDEEDELMSFISGLDYDSYMDEYSKAEEDAIEGIVKKVDEESLEDEKNWKKSFVTAVNEAINDELLEKNMEDKDDDDVVSQMDGRSVGTGVTRTSRSRMSRLAKKEDDEDKWDSSTVVGSNDKENVGKKMNLAAELLEEQPHLKQMHTAQSIKTILESVKEETSS